ncbi:MAG: hypothetical protein KDD64_02210 [Bdellovibrionales bacterium]|nr:hypothetical protein [Bdellovibrionales bacterium]
MKGKHYTSKFSGVAGEVVRGFISPSVFSTVIPVCFVWLAFALVSYVLAQVLPPDSLSPLLGCTALLVAGFLVGKFAVPASQGDTHAGFLSPHSEFGDAIFFTLRAGVFILLIELPLIGLIKALDISSPSFWGIGSQSGFGWIIGFIVFVLMWLAPTVSWLLASYCGSIADAFTPGPWKWLFQARRKDLPAFYAALIGGWLVFLVIYLVPTVVLSGAIADALTPTEAKTPAQFQQAMMMQMLRPLFVFFVPIAASSILIGRLIGAFHQGVGRLEDSGAYSDSSAIKEESFGTESQAIVQELRQEAEASPAESFAAYDKDPSESLISWVRSECGKNEQVLAVFLVGHRTQTEESVVPKLAIEIDPLAKLGDIQKLKKHFGDSNPPMPLIYITRDNRAAVEQLGFRLFQKK